jgi:hypothetical protein
MRIPQRPAASLLAVALLASASCVSTPSAPHLPEGSARVLFVGNSLTYTNDLPGLVEAVAAQAGLAAVHTASLTRADYSLEDHWNEGVAQRWLRSQRWEFVVLQQGSSALPQSQIHLRTWTEAFAPRIREAGAVPVLLSVWPSQDRLFDFPNVLQSYTNAAVAVNGTLAPAGDAWVAYGSYRPLYLDGLHPTVLGSYLAAVTLVERLFGVRPLRLPPVIPGVPVDSTIVRALQSAATTALDRNLLQSRAP